LDKTLAVTALARNCAPALRRNIPKIERLCSYFASSIVVVVENDSVDNTREMLCSWVRNAENVVILDGKEATGKNKAARDSAKQYNPSGGFERIERMAVLRNTYMDYLSRLEMTIDFLVVIDIDIDDFSESSIIDVMRSAPRDWTALFANGVKYFHFLGKKIKTRYYDDYAIVPYSDEAVPRVEMSFDELKKNREKLEKALKKHKFVKCLSAFGGIGVYRYQYMKDLRYTAGSNSRNRRFEAVCEHISVNIPLCGSGANYTARDLVIYHTRLAKIKDIMLEFLPAALWLFLYDIPESVQKIR
jgi:hypothetical protein